MNNMINPYYGSPIVIPYRWNRCRYRHPIKRLDLNGIYVLDTNSVQLRIGESVNFGINPDLYRQLPCECIVLLRIREAIPVGGEDLPVLLAVPQTFEDYTTAYDFDHILAYNTLDILDGRDETVKGVDVFNNTDILTYLDKRSGTLKFLGFNPS